MACCVILNQPSVETPADDSSDKPASVFPTSCSQSTPNPDGSESLSPNEASLDARRSVAENISTSEVSNHVFKDPWKNLLAQAKNKSRKSRPREHKSTVGVITYTLNQTPRLLDVVNDDPPDINKSVEKASKKKSTSPTEKSKIKTRKQNGLETSISSISETDEKSRQTRRAKRASSVEWDWSGNDSDTAKLPQNKRNKRALNARKRTPSIDSSWIFSDDDVKGEMDDSSSSPGPTHKCLLCSKTFNRPWRLRSHLYRHIRIMGPYACDFEGCSRSYFYKTHLDRHKSRNHSDLVVACQFKCAEEDCEKLFLSGSGLKRHINKIHSGKSVKFPCPQCDKSFSKNKQLRYHIAEHEGQPPLKCKKCNAGAYTDNMLKRHMRTHKEYPCDVPGCEQVFNNYSALGKHKSEHNKCFRSLQCAHCKRTFSTGNNLRQHVMTHLEDKKVFKCPYDSCDRVYYQERNLQSHIRLKHEKQSNFSCPWSDCEKMFMSKRALWKHISVHENGPAKPVQKKKDRAPRKDKGKPKKAMASMLAGMMVPAQVEKQLLKESPVVKMSDSEPEDAPAHRTRRRSKIDIPLLIAGSSMQSGISEDMKNTPQHINDSCGANNTQSSVLVDNSIIDDLTDRMYEVSAGGFLVELTLADDEGQTDVAVEPLAEKISTDYDEGQAAVAVQPPQPQTFEENQPNQLIPECENKNPHSSNGIAAPLSFSSERAPMMSATLCAETIIECKSTEVERVILVIPKIGQSSAATEDTIAVNPDAVVRVLSGNVDVYSVAEGRSTVVKEGDQRAEIYEMEHHNTVKKVSVTDPSVSSILHPLIKKLIELPKEKLQDIAKVSFPAMIGFKELFNASFKKGRIKNPGFSTEELQKETLSPLISTDRVMVKNPAHDKSMVSNQAGVTQHASSPSGVCCPCDYDEVQINEVDNNEALSDNWTESVSNCSTICSCCSTILNDSLRTVKRRNSVLDERSPRSTNLSSKNHYVQYDVKSVEEPMNIEKNNECQERMLDETSNLLIASPMRDESKEQESVCENKIKHQNSHKPKGKKPNHEIQVKTNYSFDSSDSEPLSEWLKKHTQTEKKKVISDDDLSDTSLSSCFQLSSPKKKRKVVHILETDSDDSLDPSWKPEIKKRRSKATRLVSSDSESESDTGFLEKSRSLPHQELAKPGPSTFPGIHELSQKTSPKRSGIACRQLSESTWIDILRQVNRNMKLSMSAVAD